jgi:hypothetical protein
MFYIFFKFWFLVISLLISTVLILMSMPCWVGSDISMLYYSEIRTSQGQTRTRPPEATMTTLGGIHQNPLWFLMYWYILLFCFTMIFFFRLHNSRTDKVMSWTEQNISELYPRYGPETVLNDVLIQIWDSCINPVRST